MASCQGTGYDLGLASSRWGKAQARRQADNGGSVDFARAKGWEHRRSPNWKSKEKKRAIDIDRTNVNYGNTTNAQEDGQCLDNSPTAGTIWRK